MCADMTRRAVVVCPVLPHPPVSGGQKRTLRLLEALERAGGEPHLLTADAADPGAAAALRERGWVVDVIPEPDPSARDRIEQHLRRRPSPYLRGVAGRLRALAAEGAAFVQLEHTQSAYYLPQPVPTVLSLHNIDSQLLVRGARRRRPGSPEWLRDWNRALAMGSVEREALPRVDRVLCVSEGDAAAARALGGDVQVAPNGVDDEFFAVPAGVGGPALFFGHFGFLPNRLGLERFLAAGWPETLRRFPGATLEVAGAGIEPELAERLAATPGVRVLGLVPDAATAIARSGAVLVPIWEGGGTRLKVLEALASGRPVAGTPVGVEGIGFEDGRHGLVADEPAALGAALAELLADPPRAAGLGAEGRRLADAFRWSSTLAGVEQAYRGWLGPSDR